MARPTERGDNAAQLDDPRYAWVMLPLAMLMQIGTSPGQTFGVSLFNESIRRDLGLSDTLLTGSYMIASLLAAVPLMTIGRRMDLHGLRRVSLVLVALVGVACLVISRVQGVVGLTVAFFMLRAFGQGGLSLAASNTLGMWFVRRLGLASGLAGVGMSAAIAVLPLAYFELIDRFGWRNAYLAIGLVTWGTLLPLLALLYRNIPTPDGDQSNHSLAAAGPSLDLRAAMRTPAYWIAASCSAMSGLIATGVFFNLVRLFELQGFTAAQAAAIFPTVAISMALLQIKGGLLADYLPLRVLMAAAMAGLGGGVLVLGTTSTLWMTQFGAALLGGGQGLLAVTSNTLWPRYFGRRHLGSIRSSVWTSTVAACSAGPFIMGVTFDLTGGYGPSIWLFVALTVVASVAAALFAAPPLERNACQESVLATQGTRKPSTVSWRKSGVLK
ncbi:Major Facilitator Superfamily protein [Posidoniimonas polymericola]|uniref:Major Facilitator Superfamily protein n=1 Tax=Posidoniimonas polymericola TaxID=2528002 RepID=A0A5C5YTD2_9BACT|nr:MFS transporter [Posidoniimonas polymericola]TWT78066.1 Major Facilitator Superfamily protein [Posidoniimonas polymericola]